MWPIPSLYKYVSNPNVHQHYHKTQSNKKTHQSPSLQVETKFSIISAFVDRCDENTFIFFVSHLYGDCEWSVFFLVCFHTLKYRFMRMLINWYRTHANLQFIMFMFHCSIHILLELTCIEGLCRRCGWKQRGWWKGTTTKESGKPWRIAFVDDWNISLRMQRK